MRTIVPPKRFRSAPGLAIVALATLARGSALACAACYGQSDSPLAAGMNWGIFTLLGTIVLVLGGVAAFFIYLARKSARMPIAAEVAAGLDDAPLKRRSAPVLGHRDAWSARGSSKGPALARARERCSGTGGRLSGERLKPTRR